jgi:hypothetical protein
LREALGQNGLDGLVRVDRQRIDRQARPLARETLVGALGQTQLAADDVDEVLGIAAVGDGEIRRQAQLAGVGP